ncbi:MAG: alkaline phosphatase D family protein [Kangiellaceae bacterium]|nr:alkaline phosphatase D family protein [Kangiellaceae bacterium]
MNMKKISRRQVMKAVSGALLVIPTACRHIPKVELPDSVFKHGIASGDPDSTSVVIWTRISNTQHSANVNWSIASDKEFLKIVKVGQFATDSHRDYTVKVVVSGLLPGQHYFYKFSFNDDISPVGRTRTLPIGHVKQLVLAIATCSNYPLGHFNACDTIANDPTVDLVVHLGDYIYEYGVDGYGGDAGRTIGRDHIPSHEILSLDDYRKRHAQYKMDRGFLAMHARHPLIVMWDDHETANNPWMEGAKNHQANEGDWEVRREASLQAYYEWLPIRDPIKSADRKKYWRHYKFGDLASLITLESRHTGRSQQISYNEHLPKLKTKQQAQIFLTDVVGSEERNMLSTEMEVFLRSELRESVQSERRWRIVGNQTVLARSLSPKLEGVAFDGLSDTLNPKAKKMLEELVHLGELNLPADLDTWDGYPAARERFYQIAKDEEVKDLLVISGDSHSYWTNALFDIDGHAMGVELGATGVSSPRSIRALGEAALKKYDELNAAHNEEIVWSDGRHQGFIRLQLDHQSGRADFITVSNVKTPIYETKIIHSVNIQHKDGSLSYGKNNS